MTVMDTLAAEEERQRDAVAALPPEQRKAYHAEFGRRLRDPDTYAALNWSLMFGIHHLYLRRWLRFVVDLVVSAVGVALLLSGNILLGCLVLAVMAVWELVDLARAQSTVRAYNNRLAAEILADLGSPAKP